MNTKFLAVISVIGVTAFSVLQTPAQAPAPKAISSGRTTEQATKPEAPGGGHGLVWVNTVAGVYHTGGLVFLRDNGEGQIYDRAAGHSGGIQTRAKEPIERNSFKNVSKSDAL